MKRFLCSLLLLAGISVLAVSCDETHRNNNENEATGSICGTWVLDTLTIEASASVIGNGSTNTSIIDFKNTPCYLNLSENAMATARMGLDIEMSAYSYDQKAATLFFKNSMSVSNDGKAMVLVGTYEVTCLTSGRLVLRQPDFNIDIPGLFSSHQTAVYAYHRKVEND